MLAAAHAVVGRLSCPEAPYAHVWGSTRRREVMRWVRLICGLICNNCRYDMSYDHDARQLLKLTWNDDAFATAIGL